jgi:hypothetical protein
MKLTSGRLRWWMISLVALGMALNHLAPLTAMHSGILLDLRR